MNLANDDDLPETTQARILHSKNKTMTKWFQNKRRPTKRIHEKLETYGAADAWATARIYEHLALRKDYDEKKQAGEEGGDGIGEGPVESNGTNNGHSEQRRMTSAEMQAKLEQRAEAMIARSEERVVDGSKDEREGSLSIVERLGQYIKSFGA